MAGEGCRAFYPSATNAYVTVSLQRGPDSGAVVVHRAGRAPPEEFEKLRKGDDAAGACPEGLVPRVYDTVEGRRPAQVAGGDYGRALSPDERSPNDLPALRRSSTVPVACGRGAVPNHRNAISCVDFAIQVLTETPVLTQAPERLVKFFWDESDSTVSAVG
jgi:hypothetical protein